MLSTLYLVLPKLLSFSAIPLNALFIYMLCDWSCPEIMGNYLELMNITALWNIITAITDLFASLAVQNIGQHVFIFVPDRLFSFLSFLETGAFLFRIVFIFTGLQMTTIHFLYRFLHLKNGLLLEKLAAQWGFLNALIHLLNLTLFALLLAASHLPGDIDPSLLNFFMDTFADGSPNFVFINGNSPMTSICIVIMATLLLLFPALWLFLGIRSFQMLSTGKGLGQVLSYQTKKKQMTMVKLIGVMGAVPASINYFFFLFPSIAGFLGVSLSPTLYTIPSLLMSMSPLLTPLAVIFYMRSLRRRFLAFFQSSTIKVTLVQPVAPKIQNQNQNQNLEAIH